MIVLTVDEAAAALHSCRSTVTMLCRTKQLRARKVGREWRIPESAVQEFFGEGSNDGRLQRPASGKGFV